MRIPRPAARTRRSPSSTKAQVRFKQKIFRVFQPDGPKLVNAKVPESVIHKIRRLMRAKIRVDAFPDQLFDGAVVEVSPLPDVRTSARPRKVYTTKVRIDNAVPGLRPGMVAHVDFLVPNREDVLSVPLQAIVHYEGKDHVAVRKPGGAIELREVALGKSNDKLVEVTSGLESGDTVILNPLAFISGKEANQKLAAPPQRPRSE